MTHVSSSFPRRLRYDFHSLEDFLVSSTLTVDEQPDDGSGARFPVKGREVEATVLFADITGFSRRTLDLSPAETLIFVNWFFAWISAEALRGGNGIIDKYIGDEVMVVFSEEFGSDEPFVEAVQTARWMAEHDVWAFLPHVGIASGEVIVGYAGTPLKYNCSVFGSPVALASRCAGIKPATDDPYSGSIVFPAAEWQERNLDDVIPPDGSGMQSWELLSSQDATPKNMDTIAARALVRRAAWLPTSRPELLAKDILAEIKKRGRYWPPSAPAS
jgi:class 3 adenylate cyclase